MASGFSLIADPGNTEFRTYTIASQAYTIGDLVDLSRTAATVTPATSSSTTYTIIGVAMQTVASTATSLLVCLVTPGQKWTAAMTNATNAAHNGQRMVLTDKAPVNNTGSDSTSTAGIFAQIGVISTTRAGGRRVSGFLTTG